MIILSHTAILHVIHDAYMLEGVNLPVNNSDAKNSSTEIHINHKPKRLYG